MAAKKTTKKTTKKKPIDSLEQTHGKLEDTPEQDPIESAVAKARDLDSILGMRKMSPFGTASLAVFMPRTFNVNKPYQSPKAQVAH